MTGWALAAQIIYIVLVALAAWVALALAVALGWHLIRRHDHRP